MMIWSYWLYEGNDDGINININDIVATHYIFIYIFSASHEG